MSLCQAFGAPVSISGVAANKSPASNAALGDGAAVQCLWEGAVAAVLGSLQVQAGQQKGCETKKDGASSLSLKIESVLVWGVMRGRGSWSIFICGGFFSYPCGNSAFV